MEDFAIDLDKVLDDFEISEEGAIQEPLSLTLKPKSIPTAEDLDLTEANFGPSLIESKLKNDVLNEDEKNTTVEPMSNGSLPGEADSRPELLHCTKDDVNAASDFVLPQPVHSQPDVVPVTLTPVIEAQDAPCHQDEAQSSLNLRGFLQGKTGPHVHAGGDVVDKNDTGDLPDSTTNAANTSFPRENHSYPSSSVLDDAMPSLTSQDASMSSQEPSLPPLNLVAEEAFGGASKNQNEVLLSDENPCKDEAVNAPVTDATLEPELSSSEQAQSLSLPSNNEIAPSEADIEATLLDLELSVGDLPTADAIETAAMVSELQLPGPETPLSPDTPGAPTPDRRSSGESLDRFLSPNIMSPAITTPMEESGMSKVPGFTPDLASMTELKEEDEEEEASVAPESCVRPKELPLVSAVPAAKTKRPNSLLGLSTPDFSAMSVRTEEGASPLNEANQPQQCNDDDKQSDNATTTTVKQTRQIQPPSSLAGLSIPMQDESSAASAVVQRRPNSLNLPVNSVPDYDTMPSPDMGESAAAESASVASSESSIGVQAQPASAEDISCLATEASQPSDLPAAPMSANVNMPITHLGRFAPIWLPDAEAPNCMQCETKFTFTKRRHHCRACGKVFCSTCCNLKSRLGYLNSKEARVCSRCYQDLVRAQVYERMHSESAQGAQAQVTPNPNNPSEYCSTIPPMQQAQSNAPPPTVMVPSTTGVLRKQGSIRRNEPKQVMFSDGIRPGGDLTELDGSSDVPTRLPSQRTGRKVKVVERTSGEEASSTRTRTIKSPEATRHTCLIPETGLPPLILQTGSKGDFSLDEHPDENKVLDQIRSSDESSPVVFAINKNLFVIVKIISLECCVNRICWNFTTKGMCTANQAEIIIILECLPDESIPRDIFSHLNSVYEDACRGNPVSNLSHVIFTQPFLESRDHGGILYMAPTFQCQQKIILPSPPYLYGILLQKWETPWAKVFPLRLMLRLGAEFRYYPCPLVSIRFRKPVYGEIGHTIMNLLADFRNYQYMLPSIKGVTIHMEDKWTLINFPRNRYDQVMKVVNSSNDHVMALGANFSSEADSHLVCIQNDEGTYQTQAINIQDKPRKVTGASFVVFNGALKSSSGLKAKSSIVEDGVMVQITAESLAALKNALKEMQDYEIGCGSIDATQVDEHVKVQWVDDDKRINVGVVSPVDGMSMEGVQSIHIHNATDYAGEKRAIRWTECFFIKNDDNSNRRFEPVDQSRLAETLAQACCIALTKHLDALKESGLTKIGLRATIDSDQVGFESGSNGEKLPDFCMNDLDSELIPVIHNAGSHTQDGPVTLELIFHIVE